MNPRSWVGRGTSSRARGFGMRGAWSGGRPLLKLSLCACLAGVAAAAFGVAPARQDVEVPEVPLAEALIDIGRRFGAIVSFRPDLVQGLNVKPLRGNYTLAEALEQALRGTGLAARLEDSRLVMLEPLPLQQPRVEAARVKPHEHATQVELPPAVVLSHADTNASGRGLRYFIDDAAGSTERSLRELPQAVSVMTRDMLDVSQARSSVELLDFVGASRQYSFGPSTLPVAKLRGFPLSFTVSGMPTLHDAFLPLDSAVIERADVLKGPIGVVGGVAESGGRGGLINLVPKRPGGDVREVSTTIGSADDGLLRSTFDLGDVTDQGLSWRMAGFAAKSRRTEAGYEGMRGRGLLAAVGQRIDGFQATLSLHSDRRREPAPSMVTAPLAWSSFDLREISDDVQPAINASDGTVSRSEDVELLATWQLADTWRVEGRARWERARLDFRRHLFDEVEVIFDRYLLTPRLATKQLFAVTDVMTGQVEHRVRFGGEVHDRKMLTRAGMAAWDVDPDSFVPGVTPVTGEPSFGDPDELSWSVTDHIRLAGWVVQDEISVGDLRARLGVGLYRATLQWDEERPVIVMDYPDDANWNIGVSYQLAPWVTVYAGSQSAVELGTLQAAVESVTGVHYAPTETRQTQVGAKFELLDGKLGLAVEAFRMEQRNLLRWSGTADNWTLTPTAGSNTRGLEFEIVGRLLPQLDVSLAMQFMRARQAVFGMEQAEPYLLPALAAPSRAMQLLARYHLPTESGDESSIGLAFRAQSGMWVMPPSPEMIAPDLRVPGGGWFNLSWRRSWGPWSTALSLNNVFDKRMYTGAVEQTYVVAQPRRSVAFTLAWHH